MNTKKTIEAIIAPPAPHMVGNGFRVHGFFPGGRIGKRHGGTGAGRLWYRAPSRCHHGSRGARVRQGGRFQEDNGLLKTVVADLQR